jgi:hypothetical protein
MRFIWNGAGFIDTGTASWTIDQAPDLGFEYDGIFYNDANGTRLHLRGGGQSPLSDDEVAAIQAYLQSVTPPAPVAPTAAELQAELIAAVQAHLDSVARTRGYDGILSLCTYAASSITQFANEGQAGVNWRDAVWAYCYQVMAAVQAATRTIPTAEQLISELPTIDW